MLKVSMIRAALRPTFGSHWPDHEKVASLTAPASARARELAIRIPEQELYAGEIRDAVMPHGLRCPRCGSPRAVRFGRRREAQRYRCKACMRTFTNFTGTVLHGLRRLDLWLDFCRCLTEGLSVRHVAAELGISKNTSFAWRHRVISALASADSDIMCEGLVELAQLPMLRSFKGSRVPAEAHMGGLKSSVRRHHRVYGHLIPRSRQITMVVAVDRAGRVRATVAPCGEALTPTLAKMTQADAEVCTPRFGSRLRFGTGWPGGVKWICTSAQAPGRTSKDDGCPLYHVRNANRLIHYFMEWMMRFCGVATKYLLRYFAWYLRCAALAVVNSRVTAKLLLFEALGGPSVIRQMG